jgi:RNA 2',3'-cyclic 3'-phosphodiesterase
VTTARLFLALWPDPRTLASLASFQLLTQWPAGSRLVPHRNFHVTLHFLGEVTHERMLMMRTVLAIPSPLVRMDLDLPEIWDHGTAILAASATPPELADFRALLGERLSNMGLTVDGRDFRPHVTVARDVDCASQLGTTSIEWVSSGFSLVESLAGHYHVVQDYP